MQWSLIHFRRGHNIDSKFSSSQLEGESVLRQDGVVTNNESHFAYLKEQQSCPNTCTLGRQVHLLARILYHTPALQWLWVKPEAYLTCLFWAVKKCTDQICKCQGSTVLALYLKINCLGEVQLFLGLKLNISFYCLVEDIVLCSEQYSQQHPHSKYECHVIFLLMLPHCRQRACYQLFH